MVYYTLSTKYSILKLMKIGFYKQTAGSVFVTTLKRVAKKRQHDMVEINAEDVSMEILWDVTIFVAECSKPDNSLVYLLGQALARKKAVLLFHDKAIVTKEKVFEKLGIPQNSNITLVSYTPDILSESIDKYIKSFERGTKRFNFVLTPDLEDYLEWVPFNRKKHKSDFVRDLLIDEMGKDKKYQAYKKE